MRAKTVQGFCRVRRRRRDAGIFAGCGKGRLAIAGLSHCDDVVRDPGNVSLLVESWFRMRRRQGVGEIGVAVGTLMLEVERVEDGGFRGSLGLRSWTPCIALWRSVGLR